MSDLRDLSRVEARAVITPGATLDTLWPADSRIEGWVMDTGTPLTNRIGVQYISFARHESHFCTCPTQGPRGIPSWRSNASRGASLIGSKGVLAGARPVRSSRKVCHSCLWVCLWGNYPGDEWDFRPYWCWRVNFQFINNGWPITINGAGLFAKHVSHFYACPNPGPRGKLPWRSNASRRPLIGSKWTLSAGAKTRERFQEGVTLRPLGLSQWKLSRRRVRFSSLLKLMGKFLDYQQWLTCNHQWYWAATSCPETGT